MNELTINILRKQFNINEAVIAYVNERKIHTRKV